MLASKEEKEEEEEKAEALCAICYGALSEGALETLSCSHTYHTACLKQLQAFGVQQTCRMCRKELPQGPDLLFESAIHRYLVLNRRHGQGEGLPWRTVSDRADLQELEEVTRRRMRRASALPEGFVGRTTLATIRRA